MSTAAELVTMAYRENNLIPVGKSPTTAEATEGLARLNNVVAALFGHELGESLYDWNVPDPQRTAPVAARYPLLPGGEDKPSDVYLYPPANTRLLVKTTANTTIYFPESPSDGARMAFIDLGLSGVVTFNGNGRLIDGSATAVTPTVTTLTTWLYRADLGQWQALATLEDDDDSPLPVEFDDLLVGMTNIRLCPRHGKQPQPATTAVVASQITKLKARYRQYTPQIISNDTSPTSSAETSIVDWMA